MRELHLVFVILIQHCSDICEPRAAPAEITGQPFLSAGISQANPCPELCCFFIFAPRKLGANIGSMQQNYSICSSVPNPSVAENEGTLIDVKLHDLVWIKEGTLTHLGPGIIFWFTK